MDGSEAAAMNPKLLEALAWVLIYGGLLAASVGWFVLATRPVLGGSVLTAGGLSAAVGVVLIYLRSRIKDLP
jgi:hypothetical protein